MWRRWPLDAHQFRLNHVTFYSHDEEDKKKNVILLCFGGMFARSNSSAHRKDMGTQPTRVAPGVTIISFCSLYLRYYEHNTSQLCLVCDPGFDTSPVCWKGASTRWEQDAHTHGWTRAQSSTASSSQRHTVQQTLHVH